MPNVDEIADGVFRISIFDNQVGIQFNHFLIQDEEPLLFHTGSRKLAVQVIEGASQVINPKDLRWIGYSHFEPDECGGLNEWLGIAPNAIPMTSQVGSMVHLREFSDRPARGMADQETFSTGQKHFRFIKTPHLPHGWDAGLLFEETTGTLFCSDLFFQPGDAKALAGIEVMDFIRNVLVKTLNGPMADDLPYTANTDPMLMKLAALKPKTLAVMHGSSLNCDGPVALNTLASFYREIFGKGSGSL